MKATCSPNPAGFQPIQITLTIETQEEAEYLIAFATNLTPDEIQRTSGNYCLTERACVLATEALTALGNALLDEDFEAADIYA